MVSVERLRLDGADSGMFGGNSNGAIKSAAAGHRMGAPR